MPVFGFPEVLLDLLPAALRQLIAFATLPHANSSMCSCFSSSFHGDIMELLVQ
jgi:hypothetical protein